MAWLVKFSLNCVLAVFVALIPETSQSQHQEVAFKIQKIKVGGVPLTVELAQTDEQRERGLMYRKSLPEGHGMLFIFDEEQSLSFWMRNTFVPLSIAYFDKNKILLEIFDMTPVISELETRPRSYPSSRPAQYALEVPQGWFKKKNIKEGATLEFKP